MESSSFGKLVVTLEGGPEQEYELSKTRVTLGRGMTNDIILNDGRVSRSHAALECASTGCTLIDLGSSNGTRVNGVRQERIELLPGDLIMLGNTSLKYEALQLTEQLAMTMIDTDLELEQTLDHEVLPMAINETSQARLVIFTKERTWEISLEDFDQIQIGRTEENQVVIDSPSVSRHHAEVIRKGGVFILHDQGSTNSTWYHEQTVDQLILQDGDTFRIGEAQLIFKSGFQEQALTLADESLARKAERAIVVFVPGMMGSELWLGNQRIWPDVKTMFKNPEVFKYPSEIPLEPRGIVDQVVIVPNLIKQDQYNRLGDYLVEDLGYQRGIDFFEFAYDWRQDVRISAKELGSLIELLPADKPVILIAHSLGTMVSRYYIERLGGKKRVERVILMGGPHHGVVKALVSLLVAPQILPFGIMGERMRQVSLTFPTSYQILPTYPLVVDQKGTELNFLKDDTWLEEKYRPMLHAAREFRLELGKRSSIPAISIFGYGIKTLAGVQLERNPDGSIKKVDYFSEDTGDSTVLERSTVLEGSEIHPVQQYHGSLFVDNDVKMRLKLELARGAPTPRK